MTIKQELLEIIATEVSQFNDFETYELFENTSKQEFLSNLQLGFYLDLTLDAYNSHLNQFTSRSITNEHIYDSIATYLYLIDYTDVPYVFKNLFNPVLVYDFVLTHNVFTLNNRIYLKL